MGPLVEGSKLLLGLRLIRLMVYLLVAFVDAYELFLYILVIRHILVLEALYVEEDVLHLLNVLSFVP